MTDHSTVVNGEAFAENSLPGRIVDRKREIDLAMRSLRPLVRRRIPLHLWLCGDSGTGKTMVARHVQSRLAEKDGVETAYVSCWQRNTLYKVTDALVDHFRILRAEQNSTNFKLERLRRHLAGRPLVVVLDEIDQTFPKDRNAILRGLMDFKKVGLICVSRNPRTFYELHSSVKSRLAPRIVQFGPYSLNAVEQILTHRAYEGLAAGSWTRSALRRIARASRGDARIAIHMLRGAGELADQESNPVIRSIHVSLVQHQANVPPREVILSSLSKDHRILYRLISEKRSVTSGKLYELYKRRCHAVGRKPVAARTFSDYVNRLAVSDLVKCERARVRGKVRLFKVM